jgi:hypothetical protein
VRIKPLGIDDESGAGAARGPSDRGPGRSNRSGLSGSDGAGAPDGLATRCGVDVDDGRIQRSATSAKRARSRGPSGVVADGVKLECAGRPGAEAPGGGVSVPGDHKPDEKRDRGREADRDDEKPPRHRSPL